MAIVLGAALVASAPLLAARDQTPNEHQVTVLKRDGYRVSGKLEGVGSGTVYVRASLADQHKIPVGDVLVIDFVAGASGLPETETGDARGAEHLVVMRDSSKVKGRLIETRGGKGSGEESERVVHFQPSGSGEVQRISADRIGRIYLGNYPAQTTQATSAAAAAELPAGAIKVAANQEWTPTGIRVREGDRLSFAVTERITLSDSEGDVAGPDGSMKARKAANTPLPDNYVGALMGRVGNSRPFAIGSISAPISMPANGELYLGINDDHVADNKGEFHVRVTRGRQSR
ncbi:MAG: hypothetical protein ABR606_07545 [Vicinamibacterales bacterium]